MASASKTTTIIGAVSTVVGGAITIFGYNRFALANSMIEALNSANALFGTDNSSSQSLSIWEGHRNNYRLILIIGAIILIVGLTLLVFSLINSKSEGKSSSQNQSKTQPKTNSKMTELEELNELKEAGYISSEEYETRRKDIIGL